MKALVQSTEAKIGNPPEDQSGVLWGKSSLLFWPIASAKLFDLPQCTKKKSCIRSQMTSHLWPDRKRRRETLLSPP